MRKLCLEGTGSRNNRLQTIDHAERDGVRFCSFVEGPCGEKYLCGSPGTRLAGSLYQSTGVPLQWFKKAEVCWRVSASLQRQPLERVDRGMQQHGYLQPGKIQGVILTTSKVMTMNLTRTKVLELSRPFLFVVMCDLVCHRLEAYICLCSLYAQTCFSD